MIVRQMIKNMKWWLKKQVAFVFFRERIVRLFQLNSFDRAMTFFGNVRMKGKQLSLYRVQTARLEALVHQKKAWQRMYKFRRVKRYSFWV